jgi:hypothetical protein
MIVIRRLGIQLNRGWARWDGRISMNYVLKIKVVSEKKETLIFFLIRLDSITSHHNFDQNLLTETKKQRNKHQAKPRTKQ